MAAARQNEMKVSITVVATKTFTTGFCRLSICADILAHCPVAGRYPRRSYPSPGDTLRRRRTGLKFTRFYRGLSAIQSKQRRSFPSGQVRPAEAVVPAQFVHVDEGPHQTHAQRKCREIEPEYAITPLPQGRRLSLEGADSKARGKHANRGASMHYKQVLIRAPQHD